MQENLQDVIYFQIAITYLCMFLKTTDYMFKQFLNQPYPLHFNKWESALAISIFIGLFMLVFQPFGLSYYQGSNKTLLCLGYGGVTFIVLILNSFLFQFLFRKSFLSNRWTVLMQILSLCWIIFSIGLGNFIYTSVFFSIWSLKALFFFQFFTLAIGIIPIVIITSWNYNRLLARHLKEAMELNTSLKPAGFQQREAPVVSLLSENEKESLSVSMASLLYIESSGNYIEVVTFSDGEIRKAVLRSTLKRVEIQLDKSPMVVKCHRAFLINTEKIKHIKGNSQGLKIVLENSDVEIPVSRNFSKMLKDKLNSRL